MSPSNAAAPDPPPPRPPETPPAKTRARARPAKSGRRAPAAAAAKTRSDRRWPPAPLPRRDHVAKQAGGRHGARAAQRRHRERHRRQQAEGERQQERHGIKAVPAAPAAHRHRSRRRRRAGPHPAPRPPPWPAPPPPSPAGRRPERQSRRWRPEFSGWRCRRVSCPGRPVLPGPRLTPPTPSAASPTSVRNMVSCSTKRLMPGAASPRSRMFQPASGKRALAASRKGGDAAARLHRVGGNVLQRDAVGVIHQAFGRDQTGCGDALGRNQQARAQGKAGGDAVRLAVQRRHDAERWRCPA